MRGEFIGVWEDTHRYIWEPLAEQEDVPEDVYSQLYRELWKALATPTGGEAERILLGDSVQLREAFFRAIALSGHEVERQRAEEAFLTSLATETEGPGQRRAALEECVSQLIGDPTEAATVLAAALSELAGDPTRRAEAMERALESVINSADRSQTAFEGVRSADLESERAVVSFLEAAFDILNDLGGDRLSNRYFILIAAFIDRFSLRYDLRRPCTICPTLPGVFASLVRDLRARTSQDPHLDALMKDFESALRDLRHDRSDGRIKTCIQKQINLIEGIGRSFPGVTGATLGKICDQIGTWPHEKLKAAIKDLYGFASDYPGIRHGGTPASALRTVDMRDMVALSILLTGFTPYLESRLSAEAIFGGGSTAVRPAAAVDELALAAAGAPASVTRPSGLLSRLAFWRPRR